MHRRRAADYGDQASSGEAYPGPQQEYSSSALDACAWVMEGTFVGQICGKNDVEKRAVPAHCDRSPSDYSANSHDTFAFQNENTPWGLFRQTHMCSPKSPCASFL